MDPSLAVRTCIVLGYSLDLRILELGEYFAAKWHLALHVDMV